MSAWVDLKNQALFLSVINVFLYVVFGVVETLGPL